ncbi:MAG: hypothetical protein ACI8QZ_003023 [Chlamydiales bacterium]|jgi:hypothetical protein
MGCGAFVLGAVASAALFAPTMLGDVVAKWIESAFGRNHDGRLVVENLELSWVDGQRANGVKLLDRDGETIVVLNVRFPSLLTILRLQPGPREWDVSVQRARIDVAADGVSNLEHALADRGRFFDWDNFIDSALIDDGQVDGTEATDEDADVNRRSLRVHASAGAIAIADMRQTLEPVVIESIDFLLHAEDRAATDSSGARSGKVVARAVLEFVDGGSGQVELKRARTKQDWRGLVEGTSLPTRLLGTFCSARGGMHGLLGPTCDLNTRFEEPDSGTEAETLVEGEVSAGLSTVQWTFLLTEESAISVPDRPTLRVLAPEHDHFSSEVTRWLFPWLDRSRSASTAGGIQVDVDGVRYERGAGWSSLDARAVVTLGELECPPARTFADTLGLSDELSFKLDNDDPIVLGVESGVLHYEDVAMWVDEHRCSFRGQHQIEDDRIEVEIDVPLSFVGQRLLEPGALELLMSPNITVPIQLMGTWRDPILNINLRVLQEAMSLNIKSALRNKTGEMLLKTFEAIIPEGD